MKIALASLLLLAFAYANSTPARAETGVTDKQILIGSCSALTGPTNKLGLNQLMGAKAYLNEVNEKGGVEGRRIKLLELDDRYEPDGAIECFHKLEAAEPFAGAFFVGTPTGAKHAPMAEGAKIPVLGWFTGAGFLRSPVKKYVFNVRASYGDETAAQVKGLWEGLGIRKIAVLYQQDAFGVAVLEGVKKALLKYNAEPVALGSFQRNTTNIDEGVEAVRKGNPDAVIYVGVYNNMAAALKRSHEVGFNPIYLTVSFIGTDELIKEAGKDAEGVVITQVVPPYQRTDLPTVAHYHRNLKKYFPKAAPNFVSEEGFVDAMVLVEGLKKAGKDLTRDGFITALESMHDIDMGLGPQLKLSFSADNHQGFNTVYPTVVRNGTPKIFSDWSELKK